MYIDISDNCVGVWVCRCVILCNHIRASGTYMHILIYHDISTSWYYITLAGKPACRCEKRSETASSAEETYRNANKIWCTDAHHYCCDTRFHLDLGKGIWKLLVVTCLQADLRISTVMSSQWWSLGMHHSHPYHPSTYFSAHHQCTVHRPTSAKNLWISCSRYSSPSSKSEYPRWACTNLKRDFGHGIARVWRLGMLWRRRAHSPWNRTVHCYEHGFVASWLHHFRSFRSFFSLKSYLHGRKCRTSVYSVQVSKD